MLDREDLEAVGPVPYVQRDACVVDETDLGDGAPRKVVDPVLADELPRCDRRDGTVAVQLIARPTPEVHGYGEQSLPSVRELSALEPSADPHL